MCEARPGGTLPQVHQLAKLRLSAPKLLS